MKNMKSALFACLVSLSLLACSGSEDGVGINVHAVSNTPSSTGALGLADASGADFSLTSALVHIRHIQLDLPQGALCADIASELKGAVCQEDTRIHIEGPFVVDLAAATSTPDLGAVVIPTGTYSRIDIRVDDGDPQEGLIEPGSPLDDYSLVVDANFNYGGEAASLKLSLNFDEDIRIERLDGVAVAAGEDLAARFLVNDWLLGVDITGCLDGGEIALDANRTATIDDNADGACGGIEDTIKNNMKGSGELE